jgi:hypothetical protein
MKVLNPTVTVMLASHMKPRWLPEALDSILMQTRRDIEIVVADSAEWLGANPGTAPTSRQAMRDTYEQYSRHPLITWVTLNQRWPTPLPERACPYTYVWNRIIEAGLVRGKYVAVFTDDDVYAPTFIERMAGYLDEHGVGAVYCSEEQVRWAGEHEPWAPVRTLAADSYRIAGQFLDQVDMCQVMFRRSTMDWLPQPVFSEAPADESCRRADGLFLEQLAQVAGVVPNIPEPLVTHRYTPDSTYN